MWNSYIQKKDDKIIQKYLKHLNELNNSCKIYIYGSGTFGRCFHNSVRYYRPDIKISGFIDTFNAGTLFDLPIIQVDEFNDHKEKVIICADQHHWNDMHDKLLENNIFNIYTNYFWDFDLYGVKDKNKFKTFEKYISAIADIFEDEKDITKWNLITNSMKNQHIELCLEYWRNINKAFDYGEYVSIKPGDVVINGGAAFGKESDFFLSKIQGQGRIFNFDPNISSSHYLDNKVINNLSSVLWKESSQVSFKMDGSRSMIVEDKNDGQSVPSVSIDDFLSDYRFYIELYNPYCIDTILYAVPKEMISND